MSLGKYDGGKPFDQSNFITKFVPIFWPEQVSIEFNASFDWQPVGLAGWLAGSRPGCHWLLGHWQPVGLARPLTAASGKDAFY